MNNTEKVSHTTRKILSSMKTSEQVTVKVRPEFFLESDPEMTSKYSLLPDRYLYYAVEVHTIVKIEDVYRDQTTFHKTLIKGLGTASPYSDFEVISK